MLKFKRFFKVKTGMEHVAISNIWTYLGTEPVFRFMSEIETVTEFMLGWDRMGWDGREGEGR